MTLTSELAVAMIALVVIVASAVGWLSYRSLARKLTQATNETNAKTAALKREVEEHRRTIATRDHHAERERLLGASFESSNDALLTTSLDGTITSWNSAASRLFGYSAADIIGKSIGMLVPEDRRPEAADTLRRSVLGEGIGPSETVRLGNDGKLIEVSLSTSSIRSPSGANVGIAWVVRDITESRRAQETLQESQ